MRKNLMALTVVALLGAAAAADAAPVRPKPPIIGAQVAGSGTPMPTESIFSKS